MIYLKNYKSFINGRYLSEGVRITAGILLPAFTMSYFNLLAIGIVMSVGALCVSATDSPGPVNHRVNGMLLCNVIIAIVAVIVCYAIPSPVILGIVIFLFGFIFSMLTVYGSRTSAIGIAALLIMVLSLQIPLTGIAIWYNAFYILAGGIWYTIFSLLLYKIRPYKLIQQTLGDFITSIAGYLTIRGDFYGTAPDYGKLQKLSLTQQAHVQEQQNLVSELLFKTRAIVKESTHTGRVLLKIYIDVADLFESIMTTYQDYTLLHEQFDATHILQEFGEHIKNIADELSDIGLAVKSGDKSYEKENVKKIQETKAHFETLRHEYMTDKNVENFISLGRILNNINDLAEQVNLLHFYTSYDKKIKKSQLADIENNYTQPQDIRPTLFIDNLTFKSNIFRHSLRVSLALIFGYAISLFFKIGHSYWILLTIVVILKPAYSLTKQRNKDRLAGTLLGIIIGAAILFFIKNDTVLLALMIIFMAVSYINMRTNYFARVLFMTPYLVLFFHILYPENLRIVLNDRILDTAIGSAISFIASLFFVPQWERSTIKMYMIEMLKSNKKYFVLIANSFREHLPVNKQELKLVRREVLVALANLSDAFTRMLSEPKRFQKSMEAIHKFVVLNHTLTSHLATLSYYLTTRNSKFRSAHLLPVIENTQLHFINIIRLLENEEPGAVEPDRESLKNLNQIGNALLQKRKEEVLRGELETETKQSLVEVKSVIDQFNYIYSIAADTYKSTKEINI